MWEHWELWKPHVSRSSQFYKLRMLHQNLHPVQEIHLNIIIWLQLIEAQSVTKFMHLALLESFKSYVEGVLIQKNIS